MPINAHSLGHFAIRVSDIERAKQFYGETLGFELIRETQREDDVVLNFRVGETVFGVRGGHVSTAADDRFDPFRVGLDHFALHVPGADDLPRLVEELDAAGVPHSGIQEEFGAQFICFKDPDEIPWELFAPPQP